MLRSVGMDRRHPAVVALAMLALGITGCSGTDPVQRSGSSILLVASQQPEAYMDAQILGTLTRTDAGCLALEQGEETYVLQFPYGSVLADDGESVEVPDLGRLTIGDAIDGGGGYATGIADAPEECREGDEFAIWQTLE